MKKIIVAGFISVIALTAKGQAAADPLKEIECKSYADEVKKAIKSTENPKQNVKSATWVKLAEAYVTIGSRCTDDSTASQKAYDAYSKALEIEKAAGGKKVKSIEEALNGATMSQLFLSQGANFYNSKNMSMAAKYFAMSSKINPKDTTAALYAGIVNQAIGNSADAKVNFNAYIDNGGKDPAVYYSLAQILKVEKKWDDAVSVLRKGAAMNPADKDLQNEIINTYIVSNNIDGAIADLSKMVDKDPNNILNLSNLGLLYDSKSQDFGSEINKIKDAIEKHSTTDLEKKLEGEKDKLTVYEGEISNLTTKLKKEPKTAAATKKRIAEVTTQKVSIEEGIAKIQKEIESKKADQSTAGLDAKLPELIQNQKANQEKALAIYQRVLALDANHYETNYNMAVMYFNQAVETKKVVDAMDMKTFQKDGKAIEQKACEQFSIAKPYFDKCQSLKSDDDMVIENLKNLNRILEQCKN